MRIVESLLCAALVIGFVVVTASGKTGGAIRTIGVQTQTLPAQVVPTSVPDAAVVDVCHQAQAAGVNFDTIFLTDCLRVKAFAPARVPTS